jgi:hypothetical protein
MRVNKLLAGCVALATAVAAPAAGYAEERLKAVEDSHNPKSAAPADPQTTPKDPDNNADSEKDSVAAAVAGALVGALFQPSATPKRESNEDLANASTASLGIEPYDSSSASIYARGNRIRRHAEASFGGFLGANAPLGAHALHLRGHLGFLALHGEWTRLYEPRAQSQNSLDLLRIQLGGNLFAGGVRRAELHIYAGVLGLRGRDWTPAFDMRVETRIYPIRPLVVSGSLDVAIFRSGPPLSVADVQAGVVLSRMELRAGLRTFRQSGALALTGPALDFSVNW